MDKKQPRQKKTFYIIIKKLGKKSSQSILKEGFLNSMAEYKLISFKLIKESILINCTPQMLIT